MEVSLPWAVSPKTWCNGLRTVHAVWVPPVLVRSPQALGRIGSTFCASGQCLPRKRLFCCNAFPLCFTLYNLLLCDQEPRFLWRSWQCSFGWLGQKPELWDLWHCLQCFLTKLFLCFGYAACKIVLIVPALLPIRTSLSAIRSLLLLRYLNAQFTSQFSWMLPGAFWTGFTNSVLC